MKKEIKYL